MTHNIHCGGGGFKKSLKNLLSWSNLPTKLIFDIKGKLCFLQKKIFLLLLLYDGSFDVK
jgi:hypothetical protein